MEIQTSTMELEYNQIAAANPTINAGDAGQIQLTLTQQRFHQKTSGLSFSLKNGTANTKQYDMTFLGLFGACQILLDGKQILDVQNLSLYLKQQMLQDSYYNQFLVTKSYGGLGVTQYFMKQVEKIAADDINQYFIPFSLFGLQQQSDFFTVPQILTITIQKNIVPADFIFYCAADPNPMTTSFLLPNLPNTALLGAGANKSDMTGIKFISKYSKELEQLRFYDFIEQKLQNLGILANPKDEINQYAIPKNNICYKRVIQIYTVTANLYTNWQLIDLNFNNQKLLQSASKQYYIDYCKNSNPNLVQNDSMILFQNTKYQNQLLQQQFRIQGAAEASNLLITFHSIVPV